MKKKNGFSLMEMMIVLLIVSILAAVAAPMVNKKLAKSAGTSSPWNWCGIVGNSIWYDRGDDNMVIIGDSNPPGVNRGGKLYIKSDKARQPQISLTRNDAEPSLKLAYDTNSIWMSTVSPNPGATGVVIGTNANATVTEAVAVGLGASSTSKSGVAIGSNARAIEGNDCIAIGNSAQSRNAGIKIGQGNVSAGALGPDSIAIGNLAHAGGTNGIAIGNKASVSGDNSIALGANVSASTNQIVLGNVNNTVIIPGALQMAKVLSPTTQLQLGDKDTCVYIPGSLVVDHNVYLSRLWGGNYKYATYLPASMGRDGRKNYGSGLHSLQYRRVYDRNGVFQHHESIDPGSIKLYGLTSDRRLKNVGEVFTGGLEQVKKLEVFNYTFKNDETKTPHVGVMAQDLKKIFPNAVAKGEEGFLKIRLDEIIYSLVNAVKELDKKISLLEQKQKRIDELENKVQALEKRLEALENTNK